MKLLLDESIPRKLSASFPANFDIQTVPQMGWAGTKNGELLQLAANNGFQALITADQGIEYQQDLANLPLSIIVLTAYRTRLGDFVPMIPRVIEILENNPMKHVYHVDA